MLRLEKLERLFTIRHLRWATSSYSLRRSPALSMNPDTSFFVSWRALSAELTSTSLRAMSLPCKLVSFLGTRSSGKW